MKVKAVPAVAFLLRIQRTTRDIASVKTSLSRLVLLLYVVRLNTQE